MFLMVVIIIFVHQIVSRLSAKVKQHPLRQLALRILEIGGKTLLMPGFIIAFIMVFPQIGSEAKRVFVICIACGVSLYIFIRELNGFNHDLVNVMSLLRAKIDNPAANKITSLEILVFNGVMFRTFSRSVGHYHNWKRTVEKEYSKEVVLPKKVNKGISERVNAMLHGNNGSGSGFGSDEFDERVRMSNIGVGDFQMKVMGRDTMSGVGQSVYVSGGSGSGSGSGDMNSVNMHDVSVTRRHANRTPESDDEEDHVRVVSAASITRFHPGTNDDVTVNSLHII